MKPDMNKAENWLWAGNAFCVVMLLHVPAIPVAPITTLPSFLLMAVLTLACFAIHNAYMPKDWKD